GAPARRHLGDGLGAEVGHGRDGLAGRGVLDRDVTTALGAVVGAGDLLDDVCFLDGGHLSLLFVGLLLKRLLRSGGYSVNAIDSMATGSIGRSAASVDTPSRRSTTCIPSLTAPKTVCLPSSQSHAPAVTM